MGRMGETLQVVRSGSSSDEIERGGQPEALITSIVAGIQVAAEVMADIAASTPGVSPSFTIGVQFSPTDVRISGPHDKPPDSGWLR